MSATTPAKRPLRKKAISIGLASTMLVSMGTALVNQSANAAAPKMPNTAKLAGDLAKQKLVWETCDFGSAALNERFNLPNVKCATVKVPRDWKNPTNGKTWDIRISQAKNQEVTSGRYKGTIFINPGGPGGEGLPWGPAMQERTADLVPYYNFVGFDPRGVGQSSHANCTYTYTPSASDPYAELKAYAKACSANEDVRTITTEQTAYDMDFIRHLLKAPKLSYVGYSYGTWLGTMYENIFGPNGDKFLLDSAIDGTQATLESTWNLQPIARDRQFQMHMMNWIARHDDTYGLGEDPVKIYNRYFAATSKLDDTTVFLVWYLFGGTSAFPTNDYYPYAGDVVQLLIEWGEEEPAAKARTAAASTSAGKADAILASGQGKVKGDAATRLAKARDSIKPLLPLAPVQGPGARSLAPTQNAAVTESSDEVFDFIRCQDGQWTQGAAYWEAHNKKQAAKAPLTNQWGLIDVPVCAFWRTNNLMPVADANTFPKTIVAQGEQDSQTGWEGGYASGTKLPNTSFIAIDNEGSHGHFPYGTEAFDRPIYNFFLNGKQPKDITVTQALPLPGDSQTYESWTKLNKKAKHTAGTVGSPWVPAGTTGALNAAAGKTIGNDLIADAASKQLLRQAVKKAYGSDGIKALEAKGVL